MQTFTKRNKNNAQKITKYMSRKKVEGFYKMWLCSRNWISEAASAKANNGKWRTDVILNNGYNTE